MTTCPSCGYCEHCGRRSNPAWYPQPWQIIPQYPYYPTITWCDTVPPTTVTNTITINPT